MTHPNSTPRRRARHRLRGRIPQIVGGAGISVIAAVGMSDAAAASTASAEVAIAAEQAVDALERWELTNDPLDFLDYAAQRSVAAEATAAELGVDPVELRHDLAGASTTEQKAVLAAMSQLGTDYRSLGSSPDEGFDCSGLTSWAYAEAGVEIPRTSGDQISEADRLDAADANPGAIVHYPGHVGLYVGAGLYVHSPYTGSTVEVTELPERSLSFGAIDG